MTQQVRYLSIPETHPTATLHFPGMPVVPGAMLLAEVTALIAGTAAVRCQVVKFIAPVRHGEALELDWRTDNRLARFRLIRPADAALVMIGTLEVLA